MKKISLRNFVITYGRYIIISLLFILMGNVLLYLTYENVKQKMIESQNAGQMIHAKQAAIGIEKFFDHHIAILQTMAKNEHIADLDAYGIRLMRDYHSSYPEEISIISRIDSQGRILHPEPYDPKVVHQNTVKIEDFRKVKRTRQIVVTDVFTNRRGFKSIIAHAPVFKRGSFDGTLSLLFSFEFIARCYVEDIRIGKGGYARVISKSGLVLSTPLPGHIGNSIFDNYREVPDIIAMAKKMIRGEQGVTTYRSDRLRGRAVGKTTEHAVFMPIRVGDNFWSIVVATPEDEFLSSLKSFRNRIILIGLLLLIGMGLFFYLLFRNHMLAEEIERRRTAENALLGSEERLKDIIFSIADWVWETDEKGVFTYSSQKGFEFFGESRGDIIGKTPFDFMPPDEAKRVTAIFSEIMVNKAPIKDIENWKIGRKGERIYLLTNGVPILDEEGNLKGYRGVDKDITERKEAEQKLKDTLESLRKAVGTTIQVMVSAVEARDPYTSGHQIRSADLARAIATEMGLSPEKIEGIRMAGSIHDIGKLSIPAEILSKPTKLTEIEFSLIKEHARQGYEILKDVESPWPLAEIVHQHHERMDGLGYPRNLKGEEILIEARILAVADVVEAMASHRPYRPGLGIEAALNEIEKNRGVSYDNVVAEACLRLFREKGFHLDGI